MFSLLNPGVWLVCGLAIAGSYGAGRLHQWHIGEVAQEAAKAQATIEAMRIEAKRAAHVQEVQSATFKRAAKNRADADAANAQLERLHNAIDRGPDYAGPATGADDPAVLRLVVRQCSSALGRLGEVADQHETTIRGLQEYIGLVLVDRKPKSE